MSLRAYLIDNMLDGEESGSITMPAKEFLDSVTENVAVWMAEECGALDYLGDLMEGG